MAKVSFQISNLHHKEWFIVVLLPHIHIPLMQQNIMSQIEALELAMKLESSPIGETSEGMMQIQQQLSEIMLQLSEIKKEKSLQEEFQCTRCRSEGHHKDNFLMFMNYVTAGALNPVNTQGIPQCRIFQTRGRQLEECLYLQNILSAPTSLYCKF